MAACLRPFASLCDFRVASAACRQPLPAKRCLLLPCRPRRASTLVTSAASASSAAARVPAPAAPKYASLLPEQKKQVDAYLDILLDWNENRMNLTAVKDRGEAYERHVNDSLALLPVIERCLAEQQQARQQRQEQQQQQQQQAPPRQQRQQQQGEDAWERAGSSGPPATSLRAAPAADAGAEAAPRPPRLIDVGSGAGLPGIILAIARPEWEVTCLDSLQKRCKFTEEAVVAAGLSNVRVHWGRAEDAGQDRVLRQRFDVALARAVAQTPVLAELCLPLVRVGGHWVAAKGPAPQEEVAAAKAAVSKLGGASLEVEEVDSDGPEGRRTAVVVAKTRATPPQYPRKPGVPGRKPL